MIPVWFILFDSVFSVAVILIIIITVYNAKKRNSGNASTHRSSDTETDRLCRELSAEELYERACALVGEDGLASDYSRWEKFIQTASDKGYIPAVREWGIYKINKDNISASELLSRAAEAGDKKAVQELYEMYYYGVHRGEPLIEPDREKALEIIRPFADNGSSVAQRLIGDYLYYEEDNDKKALEWYLKAAEGGDAEAMVQAADIYFYEDDNDSRIKWLLKAAEQNFADAESELGGYYSDEDNPDYPKALEYYKRASEHGDSTAPCYVGEMYLKGEGVEKDEAQAYEWFKKAEGMGSVYGKYLLGKCYMDGISVPQDTAKAISLYTEAAKYDSDAQFDLGLRYIEGNAVKKDIKKGIAYLEKSAEDKEEAQSKLAEIYYAGKIVKKDEDRAHGLWQKAAKSGDADAKDSLKIYFHETVD